MKVDILSTPAGTCEKKVRQSATARETNMIRRFLRAISHFLKAHGAYRTHEVLRRIYIRVRRLNLSLNKRKKSEEVKANQLLIRDALLQQPDSVIITCRHVGRYYHFIFDFVLPLFEITQMIPKNAKIQVYYDSPLATYLVDFFGRRINLVDTISPDAFMIQTVGMNPLINPANAYQLTRFKNEVFIRYDVRKKENCSKIIFIERKEIHASYYDHPNGVGGGSMIRSILNAVELSESIRESISDEYEYHHVILEDLTLQEQIELFYNAHLIIGLHGAGLTNILWMDKRSHVVEIGHEYRNHFKRLSQLMDLNFYRYKNNYASHFAVEISDFLRWLQSKRGLQHVFRS